jgi:hypothetical protein
MWVKLSNNIVTSIRPLDRAQNLTVVSEGPFPWTTYGIPTH